MQCETCKDSGHIGGVQPGTDNYPTEHWDEACGNCYRGAAVALQEAIEQLPMAEQDDAAKEAMGLAGIHVNPIGNSPGVLVEYYRP